MMSNLTILELYRFLNGTRNTFASNFIEPAVTANGSASISQLIGVLMEKNSYDIFIPLSGKVAALNIRDFLGIRNITSTNPATLGKIIPTLNSESRTVEAARLMSLCRLRALPLLEKNEIIGQISAKRIVRQFEMLSLLLTSQRQVHQML